MPTQRAREQRVDCLAELLIALMGVDLSRLPGPAIADWLQQCGELIAAFPPAVQPRWVRIMATQIFEAFPNQQRRGLHALELDVAGWVVNAAHHWQAYKTQHFAEPLPTVKETA